MKYKRNDEKFEAAMKSLEARRRKVEANGYAAGALVLANNNSSFLKWGRRAQVLGVTFFLLLPNLFVMKHGLRISVNIIVYHIIKVTPLFMLQKCLKEE